MRTPVIDAVIRHTDAYRDWKFACYEYANASSQTFQGEGLLSYLSFLRTRHANIKMADLRRKEAKNKEVEAWKTLLQTVRES